MRNPFFLSLLALAVMLIFSLAIGSVFIPPAELWRALRGVGVQRNIPHDPVEYPYAAHGVDRVGRRGVGRQRRGLSGIVPQSAG